MYIYNVMYIIIIYVCILDDTMCTHGCLDQFISCKKPYRTVVRKLNVIRNRRHFRKVITQAFCVYVKISVTSGGGNSRYLQKCVDGSLHGSKIGNRTTEKHPTCHFQIRTPYISFAASIMHAQF